MALGVEHGRGQLGGRKLLVEVAHHLARRRLGRACVGLRRRRQLLGLRALANLCLTVVTSGFVA